MSHKFKYDPVTKKKFKPIVKFNSGRGAIMCNVCGKIIKQKLSFDEFRGKTDLLFCHECALKMIMKMFKRT